MKKLVTFNEKNKFFINIDFSSKFIFFSKRLFAVLVRRWDLEGKKITRENGSIENADEKRRIVLIMKNREV